MIHMATAQAIIAKGIVSGNAAVVWYNLYDIDADLIFAIVCYEDTSEEIVNFKPSKPDANGLSKLWFDFGRDKIIDRVLLYYVSKGKANSFICDHYQYYLHRILSRSQDEINRNLKWGGRIGDFDTRFFSAYQSYSSLREKDISLALQCLVSVSYGSIEHSRDAECRKLLADLASALLESKTEIEGAVQSSALCAIVHLSIYLMDAETLRPVAILHKNLCCESPAYIWNGYNASITSLFLGYYLLKTGRPDLAIEIFSCNRLIYKALTNFTPFHLNDCRERVYVDSWLYMCQVGVVMAEQKHVETAPDLPSPELTAESLISKNLNDGQRVACRVWGDGGRDRFLKNFERMIVASLENPTDFPG